MLSLTSIFLYITLLLSYRPSDLHVYDKAGMASQLTEEPFLYLTVVQGSSILEEDQFSATSEENQSLAPELLSRKSRGQARSMMVFLLVES